MVGVRGWRGRANECVVASVCKSPAGGRDCPARVPAPGLQRRGKPVQQCGAPRRERAGAAERRALQPGAKSYCVRWAGPARAPAFPHRPPGSPAAKHCTPSHPPHHTTPQHPSSPPRRAPLPPPQAQLPARAPAAQRPAPQEPAARCRRRAGGGTQAQGRTCQLGLERDDRGGGLGGVGGRRGRQRAGAGAAAQAAGGEQPAAGGAARPGGLCGRVLLQGTAWGSCLCARQPAVQLATQCRSVSVQRGRAGCLHPGGMFGLGVPAAAAGAQQQQSLHSCRAECAALPPAPSAGCRRRVWAGSAQTCRSSRSSRRQRRRSPRHLQSSRSRAGPSRPPLPAPPRPAPWPAAC